jgi:hypothetical protein
LTTTRLGIHAKAKKLRNDWYWLNRIIKKKNLNGRGRGRVRERENKKFLVAWASINHFALD